MNNIQTGNKRHYNFWNDEFALSSPRGKILLSNPVTSKKLSRSVMLLRHSKNCSFVVDDKKIISRLSNLL